MRQEVDEEFARYVRARQHRLLRAAFLVCGDLHLAEDLLQDALARLATRWERLRHENPDASVRRILYRDAVSSWRRARREKLSIFPDLDVDSSEPDRSSRVEERVDPLRALGQLTPRQRAVVVLRFFEDRSEAETADALGVSVGTVTSQTHAALARLRTAAGAVVAGIRETAMTDRDLSTLLDGATEDVVELDFAEKAWEVAFARRRDRRRRVLTGAGALVAVALTVMAVQLGGSDRHPRPAPPSTAVRHVLPDGTPYAVMPPEGKEAQLPDFDTGLPARIDLTAPGEAFSAARPPSSVAVVYLRQAGEVFHPVLVTADGHQLVVGDLDLLPTTDASGNQAPPLGPRAIGAGGRYVVFPQRDHVVRLDTRTGDAVSYPVPSQHVEWAGWDAAGNRVVARDAESAWSIDLATPGAAAVSLVRGYEGTFRVTATDTVPAEVRLTHFDANGRPLESTPVHSPATSVWGETVSTDGLAATGVFFDQDITSTVIQRGFGPIYQGLLVVAPSGAATVLLAPENPDGQTGRFKGCCTVLGWADGQTVLFQSVGRHGRWILAWRTTTGQVFEVSRLTTGAPDDPATPVAVNVGVRQ